MRILLVEDDTMLGQAVQRGLQQEGWTVDWLQEGESALSALATTPFDALLLDIGLPDRDGLSVLRTVRSRNTPVPVLLLTARDAVSDRVAGLDAGADDYLVKPFDLDELAARLRALLRRQQGRAEATMRIGALTLNPATKEVALNESPVRLSAKEFALLWALAAQPGAPLSRAQLEERLYGWGEEIESNAVEVHIHALRRKLGAQWIQNLRGVGYFVPRDL